MKLEINKKFKTKDDCVAIILERAKWITWQKCYFAKLIGFKFSGKTHNDVYTYYSCDENNEYISREENSELIEEIV